MTGIIFLLHRLVTVYIWAIIIRAVLSWIPMKPNWFTNFIYRITEPYLGFIRRFVPVIAGIDFGPAVAILILWFLQSALVRFASYGIVF